MWGAELADQYQEMEGVSMSLAHLSFPFFNSNLSQGEGKEKFSR